MAGILCLQTFIFLVDAMNKVKDLMSVLQIETRDIYTGVAFRYVKTTYIAILPRTIMDTSDFTLQQNRARFPGGQKQSASVPVSIEQKLGIRDVQIDEPFHALHQQRLSFLSTMYDVVRPRITDTLCDTAFLPIYTNGFGALFRVIQVSSSRPVDKVLREGE